MVHQFSSRLYDYLSRRYYKQVGHHCLRLLDHIRYILCQYPHKKSSHFPIQLQESFVLQPAHWMHLIVAEFVVLIVLLSDIFENCFSFFRSFIQGGLFKSIARGITLKIMPPRISESSFYFVSRKQVFYYEGNCSKQSPEYAKLKAEALYLSKY
ncbi:hypothetical protein CEXT_578771 [Caerostris extrusa]|uniref:Maturase K n=1 Tax=Caerostris extrusa TaxID=172846 RepID=A0AAV4MHW2_CAEEX|nr:hypothetical protein CEXT_578771 [Caerostris extrusa]